MNGYFTFPDRTGVNFCMKPERITSIIADVLDRTVCSFDYTAGFDMDWLAFERCVQTDGACALAKSPKTGNVVMLPGNFSGLPDETRQPTKWTFANAWLDWSDTLEIGKNCIVVRNTWSAIPFPAMLEHFATMQAETELSLFMANINSRVTDAFVAGTDSDRKAAEAFIADLLDGKLSAVMGQSLLNNLRTTPYGGKTGIITDLIELLQYSRAAMWNYIGIDANYNMKRESLNSAEGQMTANVLATAPDAWLAVRKKCLEKSAEILGSEVTVTLSGQWKRNAEAAEAAADPEPEADTETETEQKEGE